MHSLRDRGFAPWLIHTLRNAGWAPGGVFAAHVVASKGFWYQPFAGAKGFDAYSRIPHLDVPMHLLGGLAIAYWFHVAFLYGSAHGLLGGYQRMTHCLLVFGMTCAAAVCWEFTEFLADHYLGTKMQCGDLNDTLLDMLLGIVGGHVWLTLARVRGLLPPA